MCRELKMEGMSLRIGNRVPVYNPYLCKDGSAVWSGFCQEEREFWWREHGLATTVNITVNSFIEHGREFNLPKAGKLIALGLRKDVIVSGRTIGPINSVKIITRPAITPLEKKIHPRWPLVHQGNKAYLFNLGDMKK